MTNKSAFDREKEKVPGEKATHVHDDLAMAYQAHALAQVLFAHYMGTQAWSPRGAGAAGTGPYAFPSPSPYYGAAIGYGQAPYLGGGSSYGPAACCVAPSAQGAVPAQGLPWQSPTTLMPVMSFAPWAFPFSGFYRP